MNLISVILEAQIEQILPIFEAINFDFGEFRQFIKLKYSKNQNSELLKISKWPFFETSSLSKSISGIKLSGRKF